jgi:hypothetical protein
MRRDDRPAPHLRTIAAIPHDAKDRRRFAPELGPEHQLTQPTQTFAFILRDIQLMSELSDRLEMGGVDFGNNVLAKPGNAIAIAGLRKNRTADGGG